MNANATLRASAKFWFIVTIGGQMLFAFTIASFYGLTAARGDLESWNRHLSHGWVAGDVRGNLVVTTHLVSAVIMLLAGALQLVPQVRNRFPAFHRWSGRLYILTGLTLSVAGLYMHFVLGSAGDFTIRLGSLINAVLMWLCAGMALRFAIGRDFAAHRRWALRLFVVSSASFFIRAMLFGSFLIFRGPFGFDPNTFQGPFLTFLAFAQYLVPLAVLELYVMAQQRPGAVRRFAMAATLAVMTLGTAGGVFAVTMASWAPSLKTAYDSRKSIAYALSATIASSGIDRAVTQYRNLKAAAPTVYNFDEVELNTLGYKLLRAKKLTAAIRVFQLNVEAYPRSSNTYDSLGDAFLRAGDRVQAITNYRQALGLDPNNRNALASIQKLGAL